MHKPVLLEETIEALSNKGKGCYVDCTVNRGGHSKLLISQLESGSTLICIDLDSDALREAENNLRELAQEKEITVIYINDNFRNIVSLLKERGVSKVTGLIADLGISSEELDSSERGFSFRFDEPLHMTLKNVIDDSDLTAIDVVNTWSLETIRSILFSFADESYAHRIAKGILKARDEKPITTTFELISIIEKSVPPAYTHGKTHVATKTFQAIRMAVNDELGAITQLIDSLTTILIEGGRAAIITFHSTEDRLVKHEVRKREELFFVNKKAIFPSQKELQNNKRARSAQLRIIERQ